MKPERSFFLFLFILTILSVLLAGCTSNTPEPAPANLPTTAHGIRTPVPVETAPTETEIPVTSDTPSAEEGTALSVPSASPGTIVYDEDGVSLSYPDRFSPISNSSLEKMRAVAEPQGIDILTILTAGDNKDSIQVTRQVADASIEGIYNEKMAISNEVAINGSADVMAMTFVKYDVEKQTLADGTGVVKVTAENSGKGTAVTYLFYTEGAIYNINFIYDSPERSESQASVRDTVMGTIHFT